MSAGRRVLAALALWPWTGGAARLLTVIALSGILAYYLPEREQAISVFASTERLVVQVTANDLVWDLPEIGMCTPERPAAAATSAGVLAPSAQGDNSRNDKDVSLEAGRLDAFGTSIPVCGKAEVLASGLKSAIVRWPEGYQLVFRAFERDFVEVAVSFPDFLPGKEGEEPIATPEVTIEFSNGPELAYASVSSGAILRIPYFSGGERTILPLRGYVTVGGASTSANTHILRSGEYESRQTLRPGQAPVVASAEFFPGDRVSFERREPPLWARLTGVLSATEESEAPISRGFLTDLDPTSRAFDVVVTTEPFFGTLLFTRVGGQPTDIAPPWTARLAADALPVAVATVLGLVATILAILKTYLPDYRAHANRTQSRNSKNSDLDVPEIGESLGPDTDGNAT